MKFLQHIYTSSPEGLGDAPGFQTVALSKGISPREMLLLEQLSQYVPPDASREESPKSFPPSYSLINFNQRYMCASRVFYTGRDFRGQPNNYLAHNLLIRLKDFEALRHNVFSLFGTPGLFADEPPTPKAELPPLERDIVSGDSYPVVARITQMMPHDTFVALLNAAIHSFLRNRKLVVVPPSLREGYELVESLVLCIPRRYRFWFTFSTYQRSPYKKAMWCQLVPRDGDFTFTDSDYEKYWVFNFIDNRFSPVQERLPYVDMLAAYLYANDTESMRRVVELADIFEKHSILDVTSSTVSFISQEYQYLQAGIGASLQSLISLIQKQGNIHCQHRLLALRLPAYILAAVQANELAQIPWLTEQAITSLSVTNDTNAALAFDYASRHAVAALVASGEATGAANIMERMLILSPEVRLAFLRGAIEPFFQAAERMLASHSERGPDMGLVSAHLQLLTALVNLYAPDMPAALRPDAWILEFLFLYRHYQWLQSSWPSFKALSLRAINMVPDPKHQAESMEALRQCLTGSGIQDTV